MSELAQPKYEDLQVSLNLGRGVVVDHAPEHTKISISLLASNPFGLVVDYPGLIKIAHQVGYEVTGYDPADGTLTLRLVHDWRPGHKDAPAPEDPLDETCMTFSEHGWGRCVEPCDHPPGKHMYMNPSASRRAER